MSTKRLRGQVAKLEANGGARFEPYRLEIVRGTKAEMEAKLDEMRWREG
ncbi:MAG: hypothetical protein RIB84_12645 [Sneathiellaceae bacterium]